MAKILFLSLPLAGHINPSLSLVEELTRRGHHVVYYATKEFAGPIEQTGAKYQGYRNAFLADIRISERLHELSLLLMRATAGLLTEHLDEFRAHSPDYVITDSVAPWGNGYRKYSLFRLSPRSAHLPSTGVYSVSRPRGASVPKARACCS